VRVIIEKPKEVEWSEIMDMMYSETRFVVLEDGTVITNESLKKIDMDSVEDYGIIVCG